MDDYQDNEGEDDEGDEKGDDQDVSGVCSCLDEEPFLGLSF